VKKNQFALGALAAALLLAQTPALATNGYFMPGYGYRAMGMGGVGIAYGVDSLSVVANPANIVNTGMRADMGAAVFKAKRYAKMGDSAATFDDCSSVGSSKVLNCNPGFFFDNSSTSNREYFLMPEMGMTMNLSESLHVGIAFVPNGGGSTVYPENFFNFKFGGFVDTPGAGQTLGGELMQLLVPVTVGYKINENHAVGVALDLAAQRFSMYGLQSFVKFSQQYNVPISADFAHMTDQGYDYSYGAGMKLGYLGNFYDNKLSAGVSYTSRTYMTKFDKYRGLLAEQGDFDIPANYGVGIAYKPRKNLVFAADINKIEWSSIAALGNRGPGTSNLTKSYPGGGQTNAINGIPAAGSGATSPYSAGNDQGMGFGWKDQTVYKIGVNWGVNNRLQLRAGYNFGATPIPDDQLTFGSLLPVTTEKHYTAGFTYKASDELEITGTYMRAPMTSQQSSNLRQNVVGAVDVGMEQQMFALSLGWILDPGETNYGDDPMDPISFAGWYFGFGTGQDKGRDWSSDRFASALAAKGVTATQTISETTDFGFKAFGGYQFNKHLALEGGYAQFNNFTAHGVISAPSPVKGDPVAAYQNEKNNAWTLAAVGTLPLTKDFSLFGKIGANFWEKSTNTNIYTYFSPTETNFTRVSTIDRGTDPYYGVGVSYALLDMVDVRAEYERYDLGGPKIDFISAGMAVKF
jgi:long-chain fatty acid transport protein